MADTLPIVFILTSIILILTPGQDLILVMSRSISQGWRAGVTTAAGVSTGLMGHTLLATLGLGAILQTSEVIFIAMKLVGAAYLFYLGIKLLRDRNAGLNLDQLDAVPMRKMFYQGALSNLSNPKIAIFYFAYLPQFLPQGTENPTAQLLALGTVFAILTFLIKGPVGYGAGVLSKWMRSRPAVIVWTNRCSGLALVAIGIRLALEKRS